MYIILCNNASADALQTISRHINIIQTYQDAFLDITPACKPQAKSTEFKCIFLELNEL
jgi:glutamate racemase